MDDVSSTVIWIASQISKIFTALSSVLVGQLILSMFILGIIVSFWVHITRSKQ